MKQTNKVTTLSVFLITFGSLVVGANAAVIAGTNNGDGTWSVGGSTIGLQTPGTTWSIGLNNAWEFSTSSGAEIFRREDDVLVANNGTSNRDVTKSLQHFVNYAQSSQLFSGAVLGNDNYILLSLEAGEMDWDTVIRVDTGTTFGGADDVILGVWHDPSVSNENILEGVTSFSQIPEPSSALLIGLGALGSVIRRTRNS